MTLRLRPYHHGNLRSELIQAACTLLETKGLDGLTLRGLARQAGVSAAAPYHHFRHRADVIAAVAEAGWQGLGAALADARQATQSGTLAAMASAYVDFAIAHPALYGVMYLAVRANGESDPEAALGIGVACNEFRLALLAREPETHLASAEGLDVAAMALWSAAHGIAELTAKAPLPFGEDGAAGGRRPLARAILNHPFFGWNAADLGGRSTGGERDGAIANP